MSTPIGKGSAWPAGDALSHGIPGTENPPEQRRAAMATVVANARGREDLIQLASMLGLRPEDLRAAP